MASASRGSLLVPYPMKRPDQIEAHARQVGYKAEYGDGHVPQETVARMFVVGHHADHAAHSVQQEGAEIGSQGDGEQRIGQRRHTVVSGVAEARPETLREGLDGGVGGGAAIAEGHAHRQAAHHRRNPRQRPDGPMGREIARVQQAEMAGTSPSLPMA